ncbi:MAG: ABC transporter permease [Actinomycetia bacterium]|nr:ABC transporter permease [Actinomycetes bacterium]
MTALHGPPEIDTAGQPDAVRPEDIKKTAWGRFVVSLKHFMKTQPLGVLSAVVILILLISAIFAPILANHDPSELGRTSQLDSPSTEHYFGTDEIGRDIFSRVLYGSRISLIVATFTVVVSTVLGTALGAVSGYFEGRIDMVLQRLVDAVMSIPVLILALFIVALLGASVRNVVIALAVIYTPRFSRIARGEMLRVKNAAYVAAAEALGSKPWRVIRKHGIPNIVAPIIILASLTFGQAIVAEAALSFLGVGAPITEPSWGQMLSRGREYTRVAWWVVVFPGTALSLGVLAFNLLGDSLRDHLDPKLVR